MVEDGRDIERNELQYSRLRGDNDLVQTVCEFHKCSLC